MPQMRDRRMPGQIVLFLGVLLVALPSAIGFLGGIAVDQTLNLALSISGVVLTVVGMVMYYRASRAAS
jgi:hypothetical protein